MHVEDFDEELSAVAPELSAAELVPVEAEAILVWIVVTIVVAVDIESVVITEVT